MCYDRRMAREITQRELRNESGEIMRALDRGETFVVTRNGVPVGELTPLRQRQFVAAELAISAVTLAELTAGPHATADPAERARRQDRLQRTEVTFEPLPVDRAVARAYGRVYAAVAVAGRKARGRRAFDLLIAATALATQLPLYTRNPDDFEELDGLVEVVAVQPAR